jgi:hypothetical protein
MMDDLKPKESFVLNREKEFFLPEFPHSAQCIILSGIPLAFF